MGHENDERAARIGRFLFFGGSFACLAVMFAYLTPATLAYIKDSNHIDAAGVPADVVHGKQAFHKFVCVDCHTILGDGTQYAPDLGRIAIARDDAFLQLYIKDPHAVNPVAGMPTMAITDQEAKDLVAFLNFTSRVNLPVPLWKEMKAKHDPYDARAYDAATNPYYRSYWPPRPMSAEKQADAPTTPSLLARLWPSAGK